MAFNRYIYIKLEACFFYFFYRVHGSNDANLIIAEINNVQKKNSFNQFDLSIYCKCTMYIYIHRRIAIKREAFFFRKYNV